MGNGGPLWALADTGKTSHSATARWKEIFPARIWRFVMRPVTTAQPHQPDYVHLPERLRSTSKAAGEGARSTRTSLIPHLYPVIMVARISMGWNISHIDAVQRIRLTVAHGINASIGLRGESVSARP